MKHERGGRAARRPRTLIGLAVIVLAAATIAGFGASSGASSNSARTLACGAIPPAWPKPAKLLATVPKTLKDDYAGYTSQMYVSAWARWKPKHKAPYTVGILMDALSNPFQTQEWDLLQKYLKRSSLVGKVIALTPTKGGDVPGQLQMYQSLLQQGADIILLQATSESAFLPAVKSAAKKGVPTVAFINNVVSPYAIAVPANAYSDATRATSDLLKIIGTGGNVLEVHGIPGVKVDSDTFGGFKAMFDNCPNTKIVGEINGFFAPPLVKTAVLEYLSTHPGKIDGVVQTATMAPAIIQAFLQAGRPVPTVADIVAQKGSIAYWSQNASKGYRGVGVASGGVSLASLVTRITLRTLAGQGPKYSLMPWRHPMITSSNLGDYANSAWTLDTPGTVEQPVSSNMSNKDLDQLFLHPERKYK